MRWFREGPLKRAANCKFCNATIFFVKRNMNARGRIARRWDVFDAFSLKKHTCSRGRSNGEVGAASHTKV